jgi:heme oxygenase
MRRLINLLVVVTVCITPQLFALTMSYEARGATRRYPYPQTESLPPRLFANGELSYDSYIQYLVDLYEIVHFLETSAATSTDPNLEQFAGHGAERSEAIAKDIEFLKQHTDHPPVTVVASQAALDYRKHLETLLSSEPHRLLAHLWVMYHYFISTGSSTAVKLHEQLNLDLSGLNTYRYSGKLHSVRMSLRSHLDALPLSRRQKREILDVEIEQASKSLNRLLTTTST